MEASKSISRTKSQIKSKKIASRLVLLLLFLVSVVMIVQVVQQIMYTMNLKSELAITQAKFTEVESQNKALTSQQTKLEDPDYVKVYARGSLLLSKQDEQIFILPGTE